MLNALNPTKKGLITGLVMIVFSLLIFKQRGNFDNELANVTYALYILGIMWALYGFYKSEVYPKNFKQYFTAGFKFFIVVSFLMVLFTFIFLKTNDSLLDGMAAQAREQLVKEGNKTPQEIDKIITQSRSYYPVMLTSVAIFGYLLIGAVVSVIGSFLFTQVARNKSAANSQR